MTAVSPEAFAAEYRKLSYEELITVRDEIIEKIRAFEQNNEDLIGGYPDNTLYQMRLGHLEKLCELICIKYREMYWSRMDESMKEM